MRNVPAEIPVTRGKGTDLHTEIDPEPDQGEDPECRSSGGDRLPLHQGIFEIQPRLKQAKRGVIGSVLLVFRREAARE